MKDLPGKGCFVFVINFFNILKEVSETVSLTLAEVFIFLNYAFNTIVYSFNSLKVLL